MKKYALILFLIVLSSCARIREKIALYPELEKKPPLCGILIPYEPKYRVLGEDMRDGVLLGLNGIRANVYDTYADPIQAIEAVKKAIFKDGVTCIIGPLLSSTAIPIACISQLAGVPMLSPTATEVRLPSIGKYIFKLYSPADVEEIALARYIMENIRPYDIAILASDDPYGREITRRFKEEIEAMNGRIIRVFYYIPGSPDLRENMLSLRDMNADAIFISANESDIPGIASQFAYYEVLDTSTIIFGMEEWGYPRITEEYVKYLPHVIFTSLSDFARYPDFEEKFRHRFGRTPTDAAFMGYAASRLFALAVKDGASNRKSLQSWLSNNDTVQPFSGIALSKEELISYVRIFEMKDGDIRPLN
jgi:branched-chain amino acid transport system substrate-binding protein